MYDIISLGKKVKLFRTQKNLTQRDLAHLIGESQSNISNLEHGKNKFNLKKLSDIADILDVSLDVLLEDSLKVHQNQENSVSYYENKLKKLIEHFDEKQLLTTLHFLEYYEECKSYYLNK